MLIPRTILFPLAGLLSCFATGCAVYVQSTLEEIEPGADVRVEVAPRAVGMMQEVTRSNTDRTVDGSLQGVTPDSVVLDLWRMDMMSSDPSFRPGHVRVPVTRSDVTNVWEKRLSPVRTGALLALLAGGVYLVLDAAFGGVGGGIFGGGGGGPDIILIPAFGGR